MTRAQGPVIFARVYNSRIDRNADFGPGWRVSLAEELLVDGDAVTYVDDAGARHAFAWGAAGYAASPPTPRHAATTLTFEDTGGIRVATMTDGDATRTFEQADGTGARYVVRTLATRARTLAFDYLGGRLSTVSHDGTTLFEIGRDADGRVAELRDSHGRQVRYAYDSAGRLETARDLAGSDWRYLYRDDGRLGAAVDPLERPYLAASYDETGRVTRSWSGPLHFYDYAADVNTVAEGTGDEHTLVRNPAGVTTAVSSTTGANWQMTLDDANRVSTLTLPDRSLAYTWGENGKVAALAETVAGETTVRRYDYDAEARLIAVRGGDRPVDVAYLPGNVRIVTGGEVFEYDLDELGRVVSVRDGAPDAVRVERNDEGDIVELSQGNRVVRFGRDELGRIADATFPDGESARYIYDNIGNLGHNLRSRHTLFPSYTP
ncbi:MAG: RHS repeat protein [Gammaproteobacteria bacterium]|nr:RHS repeat protein [Gammaproteobacteria bacterium]